MGRALGEPPALTAEADPTDTPPLLPASIYASVVDNAPFRATEQEAWFATLAEVAKLQPAQLAGLSAGPVGYAALTAQPEAYRGRVVTVAGRVLRVESVAPAENDQGIDSLWQVTLEPIGGEVWPITVYTLEEPTWAGDPYETSAVGVFYKKRSYRWADGVGSTPVVIAKRLERAITPAIAAGPALDSAEPQIGFAPTQGKSLGRSLLADLGVDQSMLSTVVDRQRLSARESEAFYAVLGAVTKTPAAQLGRLARVGLEDYVRRHESQSTGTRRELQVLREIRELQQRGSYSVVPLFGQGEQERGELVLFDAIVRRAVRVDASRSEAAADHDVDHYYELEAFTEDSRNLPIVFVARDLPTGFPVGDRIRQPARLAGFFFKQWAYRTRKRGSNAGTDARQFAPLLIGRAPIPLADPTAASTRPGLAIGLLVTGSLAVLAIALWFASRADRAYERTTLHRLRHPDDAPRDFAALGNADRSSAAAARGSASVD